MGKALGRGGGNAKGGRDLRPGHRGATATNSEKKACRYTKQECPSSLGKPNDALEKGRRTSGWRPIEKDVGRSASWKQRRTRRQQEEREGAVRRMIPYIKAGAMFGDLSIWGDRSGEQKKAEVALSPKRPRRFTFKGEGGGAKGPSPGRKRVGRPARHKGLFNIFERWKKRQGGCRHPKERSGAAIQGIGRRKKSEATYGDRKIRVLGEQKEG